MVHKYNTGREGESRRGSGSETNFGLVEAVARSA